ncbi:MAG TPA: TonB-dependent receptor [Gammaproteobacteria bacterium]|nr:TonB-dependent receptor [Gammaproteobacteria bacterium]
MKIKSNKIHTTKALPFLLIFCAGATVHAQTVPEEDIALTFDAQFVSIATGGQKELSRAPAVATVITAENIAQMGALNLDQVLESVPGLHVTLSSVRLTPVYSIRGIQSDIGPHVLMLMNGVPITQMWQGDRGFLSALPIADIARVEIIRGPGSAVYGADAFAGVINVITKSAAEMDGTSISATTGSFGTRQTSILHGKTYDDLDIAFSMQYSGTDGDDGRIIDADAQTFWDNQPEIGTNVSLAPGPLDTRAKRLDTRIEFSWDNWQLRAWNWRQKDLGVGPGLAQALDPGGYAEANNWLIDASYRDDDIAPDFSFESKVSFMDITNVTEQVLFPQGARLPIGADGNLNPTAPAGTITFTDGMIGNPEIYEQHYRADAAVFWTGLENHRWRFAAGAFYTELQGKETKNYGPGVIDAADLLSGTVDGTLTDVSGSEYNYAPGQNRTVYYLSAQDEWYLAADWDLTAGVRYDRYSDFGDTFNPRAALIWHPSYSLSTKLLYGQAFRAPSFQELYAQNNPIKLGNENLKPENIQTLELAMDYQHTFEQRYAASIFAYEIDDQIVYVTPAGGGVPQAQNVGRQEGSGFELEMQWSATYTLDILANYAYQKSRDKTNKSNAPDSPQQQVYIKINWRFLPDWNLNVQATRVMQRARAYDDGRAEIDDYTIANLAIRRTDIADHWDLALRVSNVFDTKVYEPSPSEVRRFVPGDYPMPGRSYYATAKYRF